MRKIVAGQVVRREKVEAARKMRAGMTGAERRFWERVRRGRCGGIRFRRQQIIDGFIVDFFAEKEGLIVEIDGGVHTLSVAADRERDEILRARNLRALRFSNEAVFNDLDVVIEKVLTLVSSPPPSPL